MSFPQIMRAFRTRKRLSQSELARRAGYDHSFINRIERDARNPNNKILVESISDVLELPPIVREQFMLAAGCVPDNYRLAAEAWLATHLSA